MNHYSKSESQEHEAGKHFNRSFSPSPSTKAECCLFMKSSERRFNSFSVSCLQSFANYPIRKFFLISGLDVNCYLLADGRTLLSW